MIRTYFPKLLAALWLLPLVLLTGCFSEAKVIIPQYIEPHLDPSTTAKIKGGWGVTISGIDGREVDRNQFRLAGLDTNETVITAGKHIIVAEKLYKRTKITLGLGNVPNTPTGEHASSKFYKFELDVTPGHEYELNPANVLHGGFVVRDLTAKTETDYSKLTPITKTN